MLLKWPCWHLWFCLNWSIKINGIFLIVVLQKVIRGFNNCVYSNKNDILNLLQLFSFILLLCEHLYFHPRIWFVQRIFLQKGLSLYHRCDLIVNVGLTRSIPVFNVLAETVLWHSIASVGQQSCLESLHEFTFAYEKTRTKMLHLETFIWIQLFIVIDTYFSVSVM